MWHTSLVVGVCVIKLWLLGFMWHTSLIVGVCVIKLWLLGFMWHTSLIVGVCVIKLWLLVFVSQFCLSVSPGGSVHRGVTTGLYFDCLCLCDKALIVGLCVTVLPSCPTWRQCTQKCYNWFMFWLLVLVWHSFDCWCWCGTALIVGLCVMCDTALIVGLCMMCDTALIVGLCMMCDTALIVGLCVTQLCLPALPGGGVHRGVTTGLRFDCWPLYDSTWRWCTQRCCTCLVFCVTQLCHPALPGDGVCRGVTTGLCFDCWCLCHKSSIVGICVTQFCLPALPGGSVHKGVTTGLCFDHWCFCDTALIRCVCVTHLWLLVFVWHSFDCWSLYDVWHSFHCCSLCRTALPSCPTWRQCTQRCYNWFMFWLLVFVWHSTWRWCTQKCYSWLVFCVTQLCLPALPGDGVCRGTGTGGLPSCGHQEGCHRHPGPALSVCPRNLLQHALRWCWKWWAVLFRPFRKRSDFWNQFDGYIFCTCASCQFSCFVLSMCRD